MYLYVFIRFLKKFNILQKMKHMLIFLKFFTKQFKPEVVQRAIDILARREVLQYRNQRKVILRIGAN